MNNENNVEIINEVAETGMEIATEVAKNNDLLKKIGKGAGFAVAGALVYKGIETLVGLIKSKSKKNGKNETEQSETSDEKTENIEN